MILRTRLKGPAPKPGLLLCGTGRQQGAPPRATKKAAAAALKFSPQCLFSTSKRVGRNFSLKRGLTDPLWPGRGERFRNTNGHSGLSANQLSGGSIGKRTGSSGPPKPPQSEGGNDPLTRPCHHQRVAVGAPPRWTAQSPSDAMRCVPRGFPFPPKEMPTRGGPSRFIPKGAGGSSLPRQHGHVPARLRQR
jgi:hypothetical protein